MSARICRDPWAAGSSYIAHVHGPLDDAARIVWAWDAVIISAFDGNDDPSVPFPEGDE